MIQSSPAKPPTDEQTIVVRATNPRLRVSAAAGAGKTRILVDRYLRHVLEDGLHPDEILTITFTRKAAAEMKKRIVARLWSAGRTEEARFAETGPIQTIHGFCERVLRENAVAAGVDPDFDILSEAQTTRLIDEEITLALAQDWQEFPEAEEFIRLLSGQRSYRSRGLAYEALKGPIRDVLRKLRGSGTEIRELRERYVTPAVVRASWTQIVMKETPEPVLDELRSTPLDDPLPVRLRAAYKLAGLRIPQPFAQRHDEEAETESARLTCGLLALVLRAWERIDDRIREEQRFDFAALEAAVVQAIEQSGEVQARIRRTYKVAMVDEAQDVNRVQHRLLDAMGIETELLVGDRQQSIYAFRQADVEEFKRKIASGQHLQLTENFRSEPGILRFVDAVFGSLWGNDYVPMSKVQPLDLDNPPNPIYPGVELWEHKAKDTALTAHYVRELLTTENPNDVAILVRSSAFGTDLGVALAAHRIESEIVGESERFYSRLEIRDLSNALTCLGNRWNDFALLATLRSPVVGLSFAAVDRLASNRPVIEALAALPFDDTADRTKALAFLEWFEPLSKRADRLPAWEVLSHVFAKSNYLSAIVGRPRGHQEVANAKKLLVLAIEAPDLGPVEFADRVREIRDLRHREGDAPINEDNPNAVKIMNIHKAKGLEFEVVVLPQMFEKLSRERDEIEVDPRLPMVTTSLRKGAKVAYHQWLGERRRERETEEELRVLYVGMTRAKRKLCVATGSHIGPDCLAKRIANVLNWRSNEPQGFELIRHMRPADEA